jgi:hypothetical protein
VGTATLFANDTGSNNVAVGRDALVANTTASYNTAVGYEAGKTNTTGLITALGSQALYSNTTGANNVAVGGYTSGANYAALTFNTTGSNNTAVGNSALQANTTASNNTAVGYSALTANTTGANNVALGRGSLGANQTGAGNVALGYSALTSNTTASNNVAIGMEAAVSNSTGTSLVAIGFEALKANTASNNTAVGYQAGLSNTTGGGNTFIGNSAGLAVTTGGNNLLVGNGAGLALTTGLSNTFVGAYSNSGSGACGGAMTTGSKNTIIGGYSGNQGGLDIRTASNHIVLSDGDGNPRASGNRWGILPEVESNGVMEIGRYIDFHSTDGDTSDYGARLDYDGTNIVSTNAFSMASGIYLGGTGAANLLDDYESGAFVPTVTNGDGNMSGISYITQAGYYQKIGDLVWFRMQVGFSATTIGTGNFTVTGLPYASINEASARQQATVLTYNLDWDPIWKQIHTEGVQNTNSMVFLISRDNAVWAGLQAEDMADGITYYYIISGCYVTN